MPCVPVALILLQSGIMKNFTVQQFMTRAPHTIGADQSLAKAHAVMREHDLRHLPVLEGGRLVGVISQRDLYMIEALPDVDPEAVSVSEARSSDVFTVSPRSTVRKVAGDMATQKYGSAVVMDGAEVVGVFTTTDALAVLYCLLDPELELRPRAAESRRARR